MAWHCELHAAARSATLELLPGAPAGFEDLDQPNTTTIDLSYGGQPLGAFMATFGGSKIHFAKPEDIIAKIPAIKAEKKQAVLSALSGDIDAHAELLCQRVRTPGCGILKPELAGVIFDENNYKANVFIHADALDTQNMFLSKTLPPPEDGFSSVHSMNLAGVGEDVGDLQYSLLQNSTVAYGPARLNYSYTMTEKTQRVTTASATLDRWGLESTMGFFDSKSSVMLPQQHIAGVSVATSLNTNLDLRRSAGSDIMLFLPQRSYVSLVYRDAIYSTELYEAGNQVIDTTALPDGAYEIILRIRSVDGDTREERRFFAKNFEIPPSDHPIYYAQAGMLRREDTDTALPKFTSIPAARIGTARRISDSSGISADFLVVKDTAFIETSVFSVLPPNHQLRAATMVSSSGDYGASAFYFSSYLNNRITLSADARTVFAGTRKETLVPDPSDLVGKQSKQMAGVLSFQATERISLSLQANFSESEGTPRQYAYGPLMRYNIWQEGGGTLMATLDHTYTQAGASTAAMLNLSLRFGPWGFNADADARRPAAALPGESGIQYNSGTRVTWNDDQTPGRLTIIGAEARRLTSGMTYGSDLDYRSNAGQLKLTALQSNLNKTQRTTMTGNFGFNVVQTLDHMAWGGNRQESSAVLLDTKGTSDARMKVIIDGSERTLLPPGKTLPVFLTPYQTYRVSLLPDSGSRFVDYDGAVHTVTLYPGNVVPLHWDVNNVNILLGTVRGNDGEPIRGATLKEARNISVTDDQGRFQAEVINPTRLTFSIEPKTARPFDDGIAVKSKPVMLYRPKKVTLSEDQKRAMLDLYGDAGTDHPIYTEPDATPAPVMEVMQTPAPSANAVAHAPRQAMSEPPAKTTAAEAGAEVTTPAISSETSPDSMPVSESEATQTPPPAPAKPILCTVTLPAQQATNNVLIYKEPLTCVEIAPEAEEKTELEKPG